MKLANLPQPVRDPSKRSAIQVDPDHPLYEFLPQPTAERTGRTSLRTPDELNERGRAWTLAELRNKDWDDLHRLYWVCIKEANRLDTQKIELQRLVDKPQAEGGGSLYGDHEAGERMKAVRGTMKAIRHCLIERWYTWENARVQGMDDPEVDLYADLEKGEAAYLPSESGEVSARK